jgi:type III pantothenate kinase
VAARAAVHARWRAHDYARLFAGRPERLVVASVAGGGVAKALRAAARRARVPLAFVTVPRRAAGVTVGYKDPWRLGVDRFASLAGAHHLFAGVPLLVAGVGTAMTLDLMDAEGRHQGGAIIPGPRLMVESLLADTHGIRRRARGAALPAATLFGRSTRDGIERGARFAAAALIERAAAEGAVLLKRAPLVVLTGGGSSLVRPHINGHVVSVPDLVLKGLAVLATAGRAPRRSR